ERYGAALRASSSKADIVELPRGAERTNLPSTGRALERAARALVAQQASDGSWEGEVVWSSLLTAQFVLASHLMNRPLAACPPKAEPREHSLDPLRRRRILQHFERTRHASGTWGLSEWSEPSLFATTLVYVAARALGVPANDPLVEGALSFIRAEGGVVRIPS